MASTRSSSQLRSGLLRSLLCLALLCGFVRAQAPTVPTDHYGPPNCSGRPLRPAASGPIPLDRAHEEQQLGAADPHALPSTEPMENFGLARYRLAAYADCTGNGGCYWADLDAQYHRAEEALRTRIASKQPGDKLAIVMDIDETTLSGYCEFRREDFGYIGPMFNTWVVSPEASVTIPGALRLFNEARAAGVAVFFITGRPGGPGAEKARTDSDQTPATARNLGAAGFHGWTDLRLRVGAENNMPTIEYKSTERRKITAQGYRIVLSVGDQWSDLLGDPKAEVSVKLPNPFYFLP